MREERKKLKFELLLECYFSNFLRIILTNLLFLIPSAVAVLITYGISVLVFGEANILILLFSIVLFYPFLSGVVLVTRNIARKDEGVAVFSTFLKGIKNNFLRFLLHGFIFYFAIVLSYFAVLIYFSLLSVSWVFYVVLFFCVLVIISVLFTFYYVPLMTVTYDLPLKYIYKNSFLMSFGEIKNNLFATFAIAIVLTILFTITVFCPTVLSLILTFIALWGLIIPATCTFVVNFFVYDSMTDVMCNKEERSKNLKEAIENGGKSSKPLDTRISDDFSDLDISQLKDADDYIFHNGRMIKKSTIIKLIKEQKREEEN